MSLPDSSIAVLVATRDRPVLLQGLLEALSKLHRRPERIVVVDSASVDPAVGRVAATGGAVVVRCELPGLGRARNAGLAAIEEDVVAFTDDDCVPDPDWTERIVQAFEHPSQPDFVTGGVRSDEDAQDRAGVMVAVTTEVTSRTLGGGDDLRTFGHGANMAWRRAALERIGGFDEVMGVGSLLQAAEDFDAFWRSVHRGSTGYFCPQVMVAHRLWRKRRTMLRSYYGYGVGIGGLAVKRYRMTNASEPAAGASLRHDLLADGLGRVLHSLRSGHEMSIIADTLMFVGGLEGARLAWRLPVMDGHFVVEPRKSLGHWKAGA